MVAPKILIGGGTGFIGTQLGRKLICGGYEVVNVSRKPAPSNITWAKLCEEGLPANTMAVVNLAGQQFMDLTKSWSSGLKMNVENSRVCTNEALSKAIKDAKVKPKAFIAMSGVGFYEPADCNGGVYDETCPSTGKDFFSQLCVKWEAAAKADPPTRLVIIRSGAVLSREGGMIKNMFLPFYLGLGGRIGSGRQYLPWIHMEDLTNLIVHCIKNDVKGVLNGVAPQAITNKDFTKAFAKALRRPALFPVPVQILNVVLNKERAIILTQGQHVVPKRTLESGFKYKYSDIYEACKAAIKPC